MCDEHYGETNRWKVAMSKKKTIHQKAAQRAIDNMKKPLTLSPKSLELKKKRKRHSEPAKRIMSCPLRQDVVDKIKEGMPDVRIARWLQEQGYFNDFVTDTVRAAVRDFRLKCMSPTAVASRMWSRGVVKAVDQINKAADELAELNKEIQEHRLIMQKARKVLGKALDHGDGSEPKLSQEQREDQKVMIKKYPETAGMTPAERKAFIALCSEGIKNYTKLLDSQRQLITTSAQVRALLHTHDGEESEESSEVIEARVLEYTKRRFAGRKDAQKVLGNPESRRKVLSLFQKALTDTNLHRDLEALAENTEDHGEVITGQCEVQDIEIPLDE